MEQLDLNNIFFQENKTKKWIENRFNPCDFLKLVIQEYLIIECTESVALETLPSNLFSLNYILRGGVQLSQIDGSHIDLPNAVSFGITQKFFRFRFSAFTKLLVVVLNPGYASYIIDKPLSEFFEKFIPIDEFFDTKTNLNLIVELQTLSTHREIVSKMEHYLIDKILQKSNEKYVHQSLSKIHQRNGLITVKEILGDLPVCRDTFEKKFKIQVGTTPKKYANIIRFKNILGRTPETDKLIDIALAAGFYDQSHFIKYFKFHTGKLPSDCF
ncbi:MAG: helix-turn-helix domain-containing protein [Sphingobacterium sp.]